MVVVLVLYLELLGHTWYEGTDKTQATTVVENATLIINGGEFSSKSDAFGGGEGKSYTKKLLY